MTATVRAGCGRFDVEAMFGLGVFGLFLLIGVGGFVVWVWTLIDVIQVPDDSMYRAGNKLVWVLVILFANIIGSIIYLAVGRPVRR